MGFDLQDGVIYFALGLGAVALLWFVLGVRRIRRWRLAGGAAHCLGGALATALSAALLLAAVNLVTYHQLTREVPAARLSVAQTGAQTYAVTLTPVEQLPRTYTLYGDEWQLDARFIKWKSWAVLLGKDPLYRFERLSGRYRDITQETGAKRSVYSLAHARGVDLWTLARDYGRWLPWVDAYYGSAAYLPLVDGATYLISMASSGLVVRPADPGSWKVLDDWK